MHIMTQRLNATEALQLGRRIRETRAERALTLKDLGAKTHVHHSQLSRIEQGRITLVSKNILTICTFLQIPILPETCDSQEILISRVKRLISASPSTEPVLARLLDALEELVRRP